MGYGRSVIWGAVAALLVAATAVVAVAIVLPASRASMTTPGNRVIVVIAAPAGQGGGRVAQMIGLADVSSGSTYVGLVDPLTRVILPGTTADRLRDAYAFGGGVGVAKAYAKGHGQQALPSISMDESALAAIVDGLGGVTVTIPGDANVFDGTRLYTFRSGPMHLSGAEVVALVSSAEYMKELDRQSTLRASVTEAVLRSLASSPEDLSELVSTGHVTSTLAPADLVTVAGRLQAGLGHATVTSLPR